MYDFTYHRPGSLDDAANKAASGEEAMILAGGMTLIPTLKQRLAQPSDLVDLAGIGDLAGVSEEGGKVVIGAMTTHASVADNDIVKSKIPALAHLAGGIGDPQVRNCGTIGGSVANNDPAACYPAGCVGLGATIRTNKRELAAEAFFTGMFETALEEGEIVTAVAFPVPEKAAYQKFKQPASRYALVGVFVAKTGDGVCVAVTGAGEDGVFRAAAIEEALAKSFAPEAVDSVTISSDGMNSDIHGSAAYRASLVKTLAKRAVAACD